MQLPSTQQRRYVNITGLIKNISEWNFAAFLFCELSQPLTQW